MNCPRCQREVPAGAPQCPSCGAAVFASGIQQPPGYAPTGFPQQGYPQQGYPQQGYPQPGYPPPGYPPPGYPQGYPPPGYPPYPGNYGAVDPALSAVIPVNQSGWAVASGYMGLISIVVPFLGLLAIGAGVMALISIKKRPGLGGMYRAIIGIVLGALSSLVYVPLILLAIIGAMAN